MNEEEKGAIEFLKALKKKQDTEINKLNRALEEMANCLDVNLSLSLKDYEGGQKEKIKEYFMKE